jgi:hypothetical protein
MRQRHEKLLTRGGFVRGGALAAGSVGAGLGAAGWLVDNATSASPAQDREIFNLALMLEHLQASFYGEALANGALRGELREFAEVVVEHERQHVSALQRALGSAAHSPPRFHFGQATRDPALFAKAAATLEDLGVSAYNGQAGNLTKPALAAAAEIVSVDARHAGWIRAIRGENAAPDATDRALTARQVQAALKKTGFV